MKALFGNTGIPLEWLLKTKLVLTEIPDNRKRSKGKPQIVLTLKDKEGNDTFYISPQQPIQGHAWRWWPARGSTVPDIWPTPKEGVMDELAILSVCPYQMLLLRRAGYKAYCVFGTGMPSVLVRAKKVAVCWSISNAAMQFARGPLCRMADFEFVADGIELSPDVVDRIDFELFKMKRDEKRLSKVIKGGK